MGEHDDPAKGRRRVGERNSRVEILRLLAMLFVVMNHVLQIDMLPGTAFPLSVVSGLLARLGGVADAIFFGITAYYLACHKKRRSPRDCLRTIWILERQLLFYSFLYLFVTCAFKSAGSGFNSYATADVKLLALHSLLPLSSSLWWYPTAYAVFIIAWPWLDYLLRQLNAKSHISLAVVTFVLYSVARPSGISKLGWSPLLFVYLYILMSCLVWHFEYDSIGVSSAFLIGLISGVTGSLIGGFAGVDENGGYLNLPQSMPAVLMGFSVVLIAANSKPINLKWINRCASSCLAAYLFVTYPSVELALRKAIGVLAAHFGNDYLLRFASEILVALATYCIGIATGLIRDSIFKLTIDRRKGGMFDSLWNRLRLKLPLIDHFESSESHFIDDCADAD